MSSLVDAIVEVAERNRSAPPTPWQPPLDYPVGAEEALRAQMFDKPLHVILALSNLRAAYDVQAGERCYFAGPPAARYGDKIKIGTTRQDVRKRLSDLGNLIELRSEEGGKDRERDLHARFAAYRVNHEWFLLEGALASYLGIKP